MPDVGEIVGSYELVRKLGAGAFGEVWLVRHVELGSTRAMKIAMDPDYIQQLRKEGQIQFSLKHPNVVETFDLDTHHATPHLVMEYVEGEDLRKRLQARGKLPPAEALPIVRQILAALGAAHAQGVVHHDLKPENILLAADGTVKVADFGLGRVQAMVAQSLLLSGSMVSREGKSVSGTFEYMSPEQQRGEPAHPRDDLYALGVTGCELLTGRRPTGVGIARMFEREKISPALSDLFEKALDDRDHAYRSAAEMLAAAKEAATEKKSGYDVVLHEVDEEKRQRADQERQARAERRRKAEEERRRQAEADQAQREQRRTADAERRRQTEAEEARRRERVAELDRVLREREKRDADLARHRAAEESKRQEPAVLIPAVPPKSPPAKAKKRGCCGCLATLFIAAVVLSALDHRGEFRKAIQDRWAAFRTLRARKVDLGGGVKLQLVLVPKAEFLMGDPLPPEEVNRRWPGGLTDWYRTGQPTHTVQIPAPFYIGKTEVTRGQFDQFVRATGYRTDGERAGKVWTMTGTAWMWLPGLSWRNPGFAQTDQHPAVCVSWNDAMAFCAWLSKREGQTYTLPTEPQWEVACRAGSSAAWPWGDSEQGAQGRANVAGEADLMAWHLKFSGVRDGYTFTAPVASFAPNSFGLCDTIGNAREWCLESFDNPMLYRDSPLLHGSPAYRVLRGGSWNDSPALARSAYRCPAEPSLADSRNGFRIVQVGK